MVQRRPSRTDVADSRALLLRARDGSQPLTTEELDRLIDLLQGFDGDEGNEDG